MLMLMRCNADENMRSNVSCLGGNETRKHALQAPVKLQLKECPPGVPAGVCMSDVIPVAPADSSLIGWYSECIVQFRAKKGTTRPKSASKRRPVRSILAASCPFPCSDGSWAMSNAIITALLPLLFFLQ
jgi:hypothetical protein